MPRHLGSTPSKGQRVNIKEAYPTFLKGMAVGAVTLWAGLAYGVGWVSAGAAEEKVRVASSEAVIAALAPMCVANFQRDPNAVANLAKMKNVTNSWGQSDLIAEGKWSDKLSTGFPVPNRLLNEACVKGLLAAK